MPHATFTNAGLRELTQLSKLEYLRFSSPHVTAAGLSVLAEMRSLRGLHLLRVPATRELLLELAKLPNLESLYVDDSPLSAADWEAFFALRPNVHVHVDQAHHDRDPRRALHTHSP